MFALLLLAACSVASPPAPAQPEPTPPEPAQEATVSPTDAAVPTPSVEAHPGTITFLDPDGSTREKTPADVPEGIAWVRTGEVYEPVVKIEARAVNGNVREIISYGVDDRVLERTTRAPAPPRRK